MIARHRYTSACAFASPCRVGGGGGEEGERGREREPQLVI